MSIAHYVRTVAELITDPPEYDPEDDTAIDEIRIPDSLRARVRVMRDALDALLQADTDNPGVLGAIGDDLAEAYTLIVPAADHVAGPGW